MLYSCTHMTTVGIKGLNDVIQNCSEGLCRNCRVCVSALGMGLCIAFIALVRLPSLKVSTLLLVGLLIYDVFWVRFMSQLTRHIIM